MPATPRRCSRCRRGAPTKPNPVPGFRWSPVGLSAAADPTLVDDQVISAVLAKVADRHSGVVGVRSPNLATRCSWTAPVTSGGCMILCSSARSATPSGLIPDGFDAFASQSPRRTASTSPPGVPDSRNPPTRSGRSISMTFERHPAPARVVGVGRRFLLIGRRPVRTQLDAQPPALSGGNSPALCRSIRRRCAFVISETAVVTGPRRKLHKCRWRSPTRSGRCAGVAAARGGDPQPPWYPDGVAAKIRAST